MDAPKPARRSTKATAERSFFATAAHDLRTPLHSANGFLEMVLDGLAGPLNDRQQEMLGYTHTAIEQLSILLEDVLFMARVDSGELRPRLARTDPTTILKRALDAIGEQATATNVTLTQTSDELPRQIQADGERLREGLVGLLRGALALTPAGGEIVVSATQQDTRLVIEVALAAVRLDPTDMRHLFDRFAQIHPIGAERPANLGLGLVIAQTIAGWHGGSAHAEANREGNLILRYEITTGEASG